MDPAASGAGRARAARTAAPSCAGPVANVSAALTPHLRASVGQASRPASGAAGRDAWPLPQRRTKAVNRRAREATRAASLSCSTCAVAAASGGGNAVARGRSAVRRRLWTARLARPQSGQRPPGRVPPAATWRRSGLSGVIASTQQPGIGRSLSTPCPMDATGANPRHQRQTATIHAKCRRAAKAGQPYTTASARRPGAAAGWPRRGNNATSWRF